MWGLTGRLAATADGDEADAGHKDGAGADGDKQGPRLGWMTAKQNHSEYARQWAYGP